MYGSVGSENFGRVIARSSPAMASTRLAFVLSRRGNEVHVEGRKGGGGGRRGGGEGAGRGGGRRGGGRGEGRGRRRGGGEGRKECTEVMIADDQAVIKP